MQSLAIFFRRSYIFLSFSILVSGGAAGAYAQIGARMDAGLAFMDLPIGAPADSGGVTVDSLLRGFHRPPSSAKPGVYWYFMDGTRSKEAMTKDLESMKRAGIGSVVFLEVNVGIPRGEIDFLSERWKEMFAYVVHEGERLGIEIILGTGPGWAGSGGPWVKAEQSMQHLVASTVIVQGQRTDGGVAGKAKHKIVLPVPPPMTPYFGRGSIPGNLRGQWEGYYKDIAVLAFPTPAKDERIADINEKALYYRAPYTSTDNVKPYLPAPSFIPDGLPNSGILISNIIDLTGRLESDSILNWDPPLGSWTIMRFVARNNGAVTRPAPVPGLGFEVDKMDTASLNAHLDQFVGKLLERTGPLNTAREGGLKRLHIDSWEMGAQNWTPHFREEFMKRRGYDPLPYYPVYAGMIAGSMEKSERFLWDLRQTCQELVLENHAGQVKRYSHRRGLQLSIEPYDMNPTADLELGAIADIPMSEFWSKGYGFNSAFSCTEAASIAHVNGISLVPAEAFTAQNDEGWKQYPGSMKNQGDWAFAAGINRFTYHTFQNQALADSLRPGMTMGPYGVHWDRNQTWWPMVDGYHDYIARCQFVLQQGRTVADILYLTPEGAPHVFRAPASAFAGDDVLPDRKGFNFDGCAPGQLYRASVEHGSIVFPGGASYRILVLPAFETMTPVLLDKIRRLVEEGATVIGAPPRRSPGLTDYPRCDSVVGAMARTIWGGWEEPQSMMKHVYGKGRIYWGGALSRSRALEQGSLYPAYEATAGILHDMGVYEDFVSEGPIRYTHRTSLQSVFEEGWDIYFLSNRTGETVRTEGVFRSGSGQPELWDPLTAETRVLPESARQGGGMAVPLEFAPWQSYFLVFRKVAGAREITKTAARDKDTAGFSRNFPAAKIVRKISGPWNVAFDKVWGGPAKVVFDSLYDWTRSSDSGIRYYSGLAHYTRDFNMEGMGRTAGHRLYLDLGVVKDMARVRLNGIDLGVVWTAPFSIDISKVVRAKGNHLDIELANRWPNRLIGDELLPEDGIRDEKWPEWLLKGMPRTSGRRTFSTYSFYRADSPLLSSGLLGPVTIREF